MSAQAVKPNGVQASTAPGLWVVGLGSQYPPYTLEPEDLDKFASSFFDTQAPGYGFHLRSHRDTEAEHLTAG